MSSFFYKTYSKIFTETRFRPEYVFLILSVLFGVSFSLLTFPFDTPDETFHFNVAYSLINGEYGNSEIHIPREIDELAKIWPRFEYVVIKKLGFDTISPYLQWSTGPEDTVAQAANANYSPVVYIPQAVGFLFAKIFGLGPVYYIWLGRILNTLAYTGLAFFAIRWFPFARWSFAYIALTPMILYQAGSLSADSITNGISILFIAYILNKSVSTQPIGIIRFAIVFFIFCVLLRLTKTVNLSLALIYFIIPKEKFESKKYYLGFLIPVILAFVISVVWGLLFPLVLTSGSRSSPVEQFGNILLAPANFFTILSNSFSQNIDFYFKSFVGYFGWLTYLLPDFVYFYYLVGLIIVFVFDPPKSFSPSLRSRLIGFGGILVYAILLFVILYLSWTPLGSKAISGVQGRYFHAVFPLILIGITGLYHIKRFQWMKSIGFILLFLVLSVSIHRIYLQYYVTCGETFYVPSKGTCSPPYYGKTRQLNLPILTPVSQTMQIECDQLKSIGLYVNSKRGEDSATYKIKIEDLKSNELIFEDTRELGGIPDGWNDFNIPYRKKAIGDQFKLTLSPENIIQLDYLSVNILDGSAYSLGTANGYLLENMDIRIRYTCDYGLLFDLID